MLYAIGPDGSKVRAVKQTDAKCPGCGCELIPKCGELKAHHWSHQSKDCDPWYEPETAWHLRWKGLVHPDRCEVVIGNHRADIVGNNDLVVELQHSSISPAEIRKREEFYGRMIWLIDAVPFRRNLVDWEWHDDLTVDFRWKHPRKTLWGVGRPMFWDMGERIYLVNGIEEGWTSDEWGARPYWRVRCNWMEPEEFIRQKISSE